MELPPGMACTYCSRLVGAAPSLLITMLDWWKWTLTRALLRIPGNVDSCYHEQQYWPQSRLAALHLIGHRAQPRNLFSFLSWRCGYHTLAVMSGAAVVLEGVITLRPWLLDVTSYSATRSNPRSHLPPNKYHREISVCTTLVHANDAAPDILFL